ncbi:hypothetical protein EBR03_06835, partial [bacterium]|nr:hypothetical protein [bacterium]
MPSPKAPFLSSLGADLRLFFLKKTDIIKVWGFLGFMEFIHKNRYLSLALLLGVSLALISAC